MLLALVARYADACNFTDSFDPAFYRHKLDVLRGHCEEIGRDYDEIEKTASFTVRAGEEVDYQALARAGIQRFILYVDPVSDLERRVRAPSASRDRQMSSGLTGTRVSSRPVAARSAATIAAVETTVGGSPTPFTP